MANLGELIVQLSLDSDKFEQTLANAKKSVQSSVKEIEQNLKFKKISIKVDDSALNKLNKHLDKKKEHIDNLNKYLKQTPLTVFVNDKALTDLSYKLAGLKRQKNTIQVDLIVKESKTTKSSQKSSTGTSSKTDGKETGHQFLEGVKTGINTIDDVGKIAGKKLKKAVETELGIRSPATSGIDAGKKYVEGVEIGIQNELPRIKKAGKKIKEILAKEVSLETVASTEIVNQSSTPKTKTSKTKNTKNSAVASAFQSPNNVIQQIETLKKEQQEYFNQIQLQTISIEQYNAFIGQLHKELDSLKTFATAEQKTKITAAKSQFTKSKTKAKNISQPSQTQTLNKKTNPLSSSSAILAQQEKNLVGFQEDALKLIESSDMAGFSKLMVNYEKLASNTFASVDKLVKNIKSPEEANLISKVIENLNRKYSESKTLLLQRLQIKIAPPQQVNQDKVAGSEIKTVALNVSKAIDITDDEILAIIEDLDIQLGTENYLPIFHLQDKLNINRKELEKALYRLQKANKIDLDSLSEYSAYTPEQISAGIPQIADGPLFFIQSLQKKIPGTATSNSTTPPLSEAEKVLENTISDDEVLKVIRELDEELGTENYLPIFHLRDKLKHIRRKELDAALFRLQKADKLDLGTIQETNQYTAEQLDAGIPDDYIYQWFFLMQTDKPVGTDVDNPLNTDKKDFQNLELTKPKKEKKPKAKKQTSNKKSNPLSSSSAILAQQEKSLVDFQEEALRLIESSDMTGFSKLMVNYEKLANNTFASVDKLIKNMKSPEEANLISKVIENLNRKYSESKTLLLQRLQIKIAPSQQTNQDKVAGSEIKTAASNVSKAIDITDDEILEIIEDLDTQLGTENYLPIFHLQDKLNIDKKELEKALYRLQKANKIDLDSLSEYSAYTPEQISAGIPQMADGPLFFIQSLQKKIPGTATSNSTTPPLSEAKKVLENTISDDEVLKVIRELDEELGTENYLPIFH